MTTTAPEASTSATGTPATTVNAPASKDRITVGSKATVCQDADLRGEISIGAGCVLHPRCTVFAYAGPIILGDCCIVEENVIIVNRSKEPMTIGSYNHFEVGSRRSMIFWRVKHIMDLRTTPHKGIEAQSIGSYNTFEPKSRVSSSITIGDHSTVGAGCTLSSDQAASEEDWASLDTESQENVENNETETGADQAKPIVVEHLPDYTVVYGAANERRKWSGEGKLQQTALMHKHLAYLSETLPKHSRLKLFT